jgi:hypothetical protein
VNDSHGTRTTPEGGAIGPTKGLAVPAWVRDLSKEELRLQLAATEDERAALLATRDRYEAALRVVALRSCEQHLSPFVCLPKASYRCSSCVAREALADDGR